MIAAKVTGFFDEATSTVSYLVADPASRHAAIIDPVLDYDPASSRFSTVSVDRILMAADAGGLAIDWVLETHAHADHLSGAAVIRERTGARVAIGEHIGQVQAIFADVFNLNDISKSGTEFDRLLADGEEVAIGGLTARVMHTPGHTPACVSYLIGDAIFVGDTLFMPDYGTARADFPGGSATALYRSIARLLALPPETRVFLCHDYRPDGRERTEFETTIAAERANVQLAGQSEAEFVAAREARDRDLPAPRLLLPAIQTNIRAGRLPPPESNGVSYLKIPLRRR
jgi:glyoxylase-like metal-dependent hydrolase (beta-lactamase superfamily II)